MESTERHVRTWIASGREDDITELVADISSGHATLLEIVKALGEYLTSEEDVVRSKGVDLLSRVIERCPPEKITRQATRVLVTFYAGKLEDPETVSPALKGLVSLSSLSTYSDTDAVETVNSLIAHVDMKRLNQSTRYLVFRILDCLMSRHRNALRGIGDDFLSGYTNIVDGEKDPRNLLVAFSIDRVICIEIDISRHVEAMFNVIFCYFPITFKPPTDDPYGITSDDLKNALRSAMSSSPLFGELAISLFLDKLLGGSPATKKDIIETIALCIPVYGMVVARKFSTKLWNFLKMEVFQPVNPEIEGEALKTTRTLIQTIYNSGGNEEPVTDGPTGLVADIIKECLELMNEPEKSQAVPASKVMASLIGTTPNISKLALSHTIPHLMKLFRDPGELAHRPQVLTLLCIIVNAIEARQSTLEDYGLQGQLLEFKDDVLGAFISGTKSPSSYEAALEGIKKLSQMHDVLTDEELVYVVNNINELLQSDADEADVASDDALGVLITISDRNSKVIEEYTLPLLFSSLPDLPPPRDAHRERAKCWRTLHLLAKLCVSTALFETLVVRLTTKLDIVCVPTSGLEDTKGLEPRIAYAHGILKTLASVVELKVNANHADVPKYIDRLVPRLYSLFIYLSLTDNQLGSSDLYSKLLETSGQIITLIVRTVSVDRQRKLALDLYSAYFKGSVESLCARHHTFALDLSFLPFKVDSTTSVKDAVVLLSDAFVAFHKDVLPPGLDSSEALASIQDWILSSADNDCQRRSLNHLLASLLNKNSEKFAPFVSRQLEHVFRDEISSTEISVKRRCSAIQTWLWVSKALVLLNDSRVVYFVDSLRSVFGDPDVGWDAGRAVGEIASGGDDVLTKSNHAVIRILYAQKYFRIVLPKILGDLKDQPLRQRSNLVALSSLISSLPKTVYANELPTLMPHLIRGLDLASSEIRTSIIGTLTSVATEGAPVPIQEHASTIVSIVLKNALPGEDSSTALRVAALKCLAVLPRAVRYDVLHPLKALVIRELGKALDDPKRVVRKEAVDARAAWFSYKG